MSVLASEAAPPIPIPTILAIEEFGVDPSIAYSTASADIDRAARRLPEHTTLALAGLLVSAEVGIARAREDMHQLQGIKTEVFRRKMNFLEQYPSTFIAERNVPEAEVDMAITLAVGAIFALRAKPNERFDLWGFINQNYKLEIAANA